MKTVATRAAYGDALIKLGAENEKIVVLDADLAHATMTCGFAATYPERFFNAGIAEANMVDMAVGLSEMGYIPFASTFAIFGAGRAYEQIRNSVGYPHSNVKLALSHSGISVGEDGGSHACIEDLALMRVIPGMTIICPSDEAETHKAVKAAAAMNGPIYLRLARMPSPVLDDAPFEIGKANVLKDGSDVAIFSCGLLLSRALEAAKILSSKGIHAAVINMHTIKPLDSGCVKEHAKKCGRIVTLEEASVIGGLGDAVAAVLLETGSPPLKKIGVQDEFGTSGKPDEVLRHFRFDSESIAKDIERFCKSSSGL
jgi:transketolase